ncbi:hypothetical protein JRQ81_007389 [Phrynocephalus forsythii]|uniref:DUF4592 domain-containing protein n=1 Tax=Phrynocephalus forsythii TaxID=171643 RepID=A0A9Q0XDC2_9SAUR|nr:hypothetical protein JRQ81_007389 [Phrynocephalus forsythii]
MAGFYNCLKTKTDSRMADRPIDLIELPEGEEAGEGFARKKKSKFQSFKNFFAKRKKNREAPAPAGECKLKPSQSSSNLSTPNLNSDVLHLLTEPGSKGCMGGKALSHDSVFISESLPDVTNHTCSQENLPGKVKALQLQLQENLQLGSPSLVITGKKTEDAGVVSEDDGLPRSPPEISTLHDVLTCSKDTSSNPVQRHSSLSLGGSDSEDDQVPSESSSGTVSPPSSTVLGSPAFPGSHSLPVDFNSPATPLACLDTSAARHRIAMNPRKQKAFAGKTQNLPVEHVEKEERHLRTAEGKTSHGKLLEEAGNQEKDRKGASAHNANISNGDWITGALPMVKASDALRYSWNAGPGTDWENQSLMDTGLHRHRSPKAQPPIVKWEEKQMEGERIKGMGSPTGDLSIPPHSTGKEMVERFESLQPGTEATELRDTSCSSSHGHVVGKDLDAPAEFPPPNEQKAKDSGVGSFGIYGDRTEGRAVDADSCVPFESNLALMPFPPSSLEGLPEAEKDMVLTSENSPGVKEDAGWSTDKKLQQLEGRAKLTASPQEELAILDAKPDRLPLWNLVEEKPFLSAEISSSVLSRSQGQQDAVQNLGNLCSRGLAAAGPVEAVSKSSPPDNNTGDQWRDGKTREENKTLNEIVTMQSKSISAKPVRFTIAPAWQRSLSGGSTTTDGSCPRSPPSSPIRSELFEGMPQLDSMAQTCVPSNPERLEQSSRNVVSNFTSAIEGPSEETQGHESPFGVKLRRTSSLVRYQMEQNRQEPPKPVPMAVSSVSVKAESKSTGAGTPLPNLPSSAHVSLTKPSLQEQKKPLKAQLEGGLTKEEMGKRSEQTAAPEMPSQELAWISMAKVKRRGFQSHPVAKGEKSEEKALNKAAQQGEKCIRISQQEKQVTPIEVNILKKASSGQGCMLQSTALPKLTISAATAPLVRTATQEGALLEKEMKSFPSLPLSSCGPAEPPWLSLAKKKAKAWSEMPQIVQ